MPPLREVAAVAVVSATTASAVGCGSTASVAPSVVTGVATTTASARSYNASTTITIDVSSQTARFGGSGAFDMKRRIGRMGFDLTPLDALSGSSMGTALMIERGTVLYLRMPFLHALNPHLKAWLKLDLAKAASGEGVALPSFLAFMQSADPTQTIQYLRGARNVKKEGTQTIRGVKTTHYAATVDLRKVSRQLQQPSRAIVQNAIDAIVRASGRKTMPLDVWVDGQGRARRLDFHARIPFNGTTTGVLVQTVLYDFGTGVSAPAPPASQVSDFTQISQGG